MAFAKKQNWVLPLAVLAPALLNFSLFAWEFIDDDSADFSDLFYLLFFAGIGLLCVLAVVAIVLHNRPALYNPQQERQAMLGIKLLLVPFFVYAGTMAAILLVVPFGAVITFVLWAIGYAIMLLGSVWGICYALSLQRMGAMQGAAIAFCIIAQLCFVLDVLAAVIMFIVGRNYEKHLKVQES